MNPTSAHHTENNPNREPVLVVRGIIDSLHALDAETADHLSALAFVLVRVARADGRVCDDERLRTEEILVDHARIPREHAALVTEIACHRTALADCGHSYAISRGLRTSREESYRESIVGLLAAVARADGNVSPVEHREILQLASELGIDAGEVFGGL
jgi:uncharacterized tellurite resistance protein B-like protein